VTAPRIVSRLWFDQNAADGVRLYTEVLPDVRPVGTHRVTFNGAISFQVTCRDQGEIDRYHAALARGGAESRCGWLRDRFGLSWQIGARRHVPLDDGRRPRRARPSLSGNVDDEEARHRGDGEGVPRRIVRGIVSACCQQRASV
jgi:predicted 3-demethylubiquinone-9 3-methyltransferase (glyoxalase superfamily)